MDRQNQKSGGPTHLMEALPLVEFLAREGAEGGLAEDGIDEEQPADGEPDRPVPHLARGQRVLLVVVRTGCLALLRVLLCGVRSIGHRSADPPQSATVAHEDQEKTNHWDRNGDRKLSVQVD